MELSYEVCGKRCVTRRGDLILCAREQGYRLVKRSSERSRDLLSECLRQGVRHGHMFRVRGVRTVIRFRCFSPLHQSRVHPTPQF